MANSHKDMMGKDASDGGEAALNSRAVEDEDRIDMVAASSHHLLLYKRIERL